MLALHGGLRLDLKRDLRNLLEFLVHVVARECASDGFSHLKRYSEVRKGVKALGNGLYKRFHCKLDYKAPEFQSRHPLELK